MVHGQFQELQGSQVTELFWDRTGKVVLKETEQLHGCQLSQFCWQCATQPVFL